MFEFWEIWPMWHSFNSSEHGSYSPGLAVFIDYGFAFLHEKSFV
jgi:hypothetical protein